MVARGIDIRETPDSLETQYLLAKTDDDQLVEITPAVGRELHYDVGERGADGDRGTVEGHRTAARYVEKAAGLLGVPCRYETSPPAGGHDRGRTREIRQSARAPFEGPECR